MIRCEEHKCSTNVRQICKVINMYILGYLDLCLIFISFSLSLNLLFFQTSSPADVQALDLSFLHYSFKLTTVQWPFVSRISIVSQNNSHSCLMLLTSHLMVFFIWTDFWRQGLKGVYLKIEFQFTEDSYFMRGPQYYTSVLLLLLPQTSCLKTAQIYL